VETYRQEWYAENAKTFNSDTSDDGLCHSCGQTLPEDKKTQAQHLFQKEKERKLKEISQRAKIVKETVVTNLESLERTKEVNANLEGKIAEYNELIKESQKKLSELPKLETFQVIVEELPEYMELVRKTDELEKEVANIDTKDNNVFELRNQKFVLQNQIKDCENQLRNSDLIIKYTQEIAELEAKGKDLAQQIADVEREEYIITQFTRAKIDECEKRINGLFQHVTFKLFDYTLDGNEFECCIPLVNGVPFDVANTAGRVNAGLDIINALVKFYGISAPIFIDNRESTNNIIDTQSQIINLVVTNDKELIIK
jgi:glycine cleavage system H lipoate-binding protein